MKKLLLICFCLLQLGLLRSFAQDEIIVRSSCFSDGEVSTVDDILNHPTVTLAVYGATTDVKLVSYNCVIGTKTTSNHDFGFNEESVNLIRQLKPGQSFLVRDIYVEVTNKRTRKKEMIQLPPLSVKIGEASTKACGDKQIQIPVKMIDYSGKLLTGKNHDTPVSNQKVILQDKSESEVQSAVTDNFGDFKFYNLNPDDAYKISVSASDDTKIKDNILYAAKPDGTIIRTFNKTPKGFQYELLPVELHQLATEEVDDTQLKIKNFGQSSQKELLVIENIYYDVNSAEIKPESFVKLDKIIAAMQENKSLKLLITSHTDSKGEDAYNMTLSEKRAQNVMNYFVEKGIEKFRLNAKGMGETQIINRCKNGVECSELEMQLNRRTEFKFTK